MLVLISLMFKKGNKVECKFSDTDETLFKDWDNAISVGLGNCKANMSCRNSNKSIIFTAGCSCHLAHFADECGGKQIRW